MAKHRSGTALQIERSNYFNPFERQSDDRLNQAVDELQEITNGTIPDVPDFGGRVAVGAWCFAAVGGFFNGIVGLFKRAGQCIWGRKPQIIPYHIVAKEKLQAILIGDSASTCLLPSRRQRKAQSKQWGGLIC